jgi:bifunctional DNase/RNase
MDNKYFVKIDKNFSVKNKDLIDIEDFKWVELKIKDINDSSLDEWIVTLQDKEDKEKVVNIMTNFNETTNILLALSGMGKSTIFATPYHLLAQMAQISDMNISGIIIDVVNDSLSGAKIEIKKDDKTYFLNVSGGDAIALSRMCNIPIYTLKTLLKAEEEDNEIEVDLD